MSSHYSSQQAAFYGQEAPDTSQSEAASVLGPDIGSAGQVKEWQSYLIKKGHSIGTSCIDGIYGPATMQATRALSAALGVPTDGSVTMALWNAASNDPEVFARKVTAADKDLHSGLFGGAGCPGWRGTTSTAPAVSSNGSPPAAASTMFTTRNVALAGGVLLLGVGLFSMSRRRSGGAAPFTSWEAL